MNNAAVKAALESDLPFTLKAVLVAIAYHARRDLHSFCSQADIVARSGRCERTVRSAISQLEQRGLIRVTARYAGGHRLCNSYELLYVDKSAIPATVAGSIPAISVVHTGNGCRNLNKDSVDGDNGEVSHAVDVENFRQRELFQRPLDQLTPEQKRALMRRA